jgi:acetyl-CoA carboxylase carboxyl transferase subunit beta
VSAEQSAAELIAGLADTDSFRAWDEEPVGGDPLGFSDTRPYTERLAEARGTSGTSESVVTGAACIHGRPVALVVSEYRFLAGTMGIATGQRVARAFECAADAGLPVIGAPASAGARMQEGTPAFVQMARIAAAVAAFRRAGGLYVAYLRHPTVGGTLASWGSLAHVTLAAPKALLGLTGPRAVEALTGEPAELPAAEDLANSGLVDRVVEAGELRAHVAALLATGDRTDRRGRERASATGSGRPFGGSARSSLKPVARSEPAAGSGSESAWASIACSRRTDRPGARELLEATAASKWELVDPGATADDCLLALGRVGAEPVVVVGMQRSPDGRGPRLGAADYRRARRGIALAGELGAVLLTVVDTPGAATGVEAERSGLAAEIAWCMADMAELSVPTVSVLVGEGAGGGALALLPADRVICAEHAWLAPIAPEAASAILYRSRERAAELADAQAVAAPSLAAWGVVDRVVAEDGCGADASAVTWPLAETVREEVAAVSPRGRSAWSTATRPR